MPQRNALVLVCSAFIASAASAQTSPPCAGRSQQITRLETEYGELPVFAGLGDKGELFEVTLNPVTGSWTIIATTPEMSTCLRFGGQAGGMVAPKPGEKS